MAYLNTTITAPGISGFTRIRAGFEALAARYKQHRLYRETFDGLNALNNRELADLGLSRSELRYVADQASRR
ncbi:MAG: DUF1127 domain-containing protein [Sulfitobacter sp.]